MVVMAAHLVAFFTTFAIFAATMEARCMPEGSRCGLGSIDGFSWCCRGTECIQVGTHGMCKKTDRTCIEPNGGCNHQPPYNVPCCDKRANCVLVNDFNGKPGNKKYKCIVLRSRA